LSGPDAVAHGNKDLRLVVVALDEAQPVGARVGVGVRVVEVPHLDARGVEPGLLVDDPESRHAALAFGSERHPERAVAPGLVGELERTSLHGLPDRDLAVPVLEGAEHPVLEIELEGDGFPGDRHFINALDFRVLEAQGLRPGLKGGRYERSQHQDKAKAENGESMDLRTGHDGLLTRNDETERGKVH
jgi:hypothetical protein